MLKIEQSALELVGNTPIVRLNNITKDLKKHLTFLKYAFITFYGKRNPFPYLTFILFLLVISAEQSSINASISSPASNNNLRTALQYAMQYATERNVKVQVKFNNKVIVTLGEFFYPPCP